MRDAIGRLLARFLSGGAPTEESAPPGGAERHPPVDVAACALLLQIAYADDEFGAVERARIEEALERHFGLDPTARQALIGRAEAERRAAIDDYQFTRLINRHYDLGQKMVLAEIMWGVILADNEIAKHETYLVRKLANLLELPPAYLSQARRRATS
ncbi:MAG TPA: TerB family tellurite resistance protein [Gemmatimonadales bacterium]|jgi:uncharacterized tellurite resistance protein B-like protein